MATLTEPNQVSNDEIRDQNVASGDVEGGPNSRPIHVKETLTGINIYRYLATLLSFVVMGMNDAAYGVSLRPKSKYQKSIAN